ncbi:MAG: translation initiation factor IF-2 [Thermoplasmata archaeon]|nr:translation initiation factor IF-2 [Thermoplasmata archaeon]
MPIRQPIVSVLGHVDHGKTLLLDHIRSTRVAEREAGRITQHIGATEVPSDEIHDICAPLLQGGKLDIPGLLFIDTPGHNAFTTLRARGGALADLAVLVVDINEGLKPQSIESIHILKSYQTPFVIAANKIDLIWGYKSENRPFIVNFDSQGERVKERFDELFYKLVGALSNEGINADRYDRITDFKRTFSIVPISAKTGEGIPDLLMVLGGLAQRFLEEHLTEEDTEAPGEATVLEVKEEKGLGKTLDVILFKGKLKRDDAIVIGGKALTTTKVKAILKPKPMDEIRDPREKFSRVNEIYAAAGVKILAQNLENVVSGASLKVIRDNLEEILEEVRKESTAHVETDEQGIMIKADAIGSLEALAMELKSEGVKIMSAEIGDISRKGIITCATNPDPMNRVLLGFNVRLLPDAVEELENCEMRVIQNNIIYKIVEDYIEWHREKKKELEAGSRIEVAYPAKFLFLPDHTFRISKPAVIGIRVLAGKIRPGMRLLRQDGRVFGRIRSIRSGDETLKEAEMGKEVAIAVENATVGRQFRENDVLYIDIPAADARKLKEIELSIEEQDTLREITKIKRKTEQFWGM